METIYDLSDQEIAELTDDQVNMFIDVECAKKGAPLLPALPIEPIKPKVEPDKTFYGVASMWFASAAEAAEVMEVICKFQQYSYDYKSYEFKIAKREPTYGTREVSPAKMYSPEHYEQHRKEIEKYEADKKLYDSEKKRYDDAINKRKDVTSEIWEMVGRAKEIKSEQTEIQRTYDRYLELAKGDKEIAFSFLNTGMAQGNFEHDHAEYLDRFRP